MPAALRLATGSHGCGRPSMHTTGGVVTSSPNTAAITCARDLITAEHPFHRTDADAVEPPPRVRFWERDGSGRPRAGSLRCGGRSCSWLRDLAERQPTRLFRDCTLCSHRGGQGFKSPQLHLEAFTFQPGPCSRLDLVPPRSCRGLGPGQAYPAFPRRGPAQLRRGLPGVWAGRA